ncbi:MAG: hypothetical protein B7733_08030 [Myxococcales bacterium FL481]|nr:MAG: hypothetical protein B7733_08030 [Myxococcales bacterium FL481]
MPPRSTSTDPAPRSPRPATRRRAAVWLGALLLVALALATTWRTWPDRLNGARDGLVAVEHRQDRRDLWLLIALEGSPPGSGEAPTTSTLLAAALSIGEALADERVPAAPPLNATIGWLDTHGLYLLPAETHDALAQRFADAPMAARVQGLRAVVSSPLFGVSGIQPRRDPLAVRELLLAGAGGWGTRIGASSQPPPARATGSGDLIAADGRHLAIRLRTERSVAAIVEDADAAVGELAVRVVPIGPRATDEAAAQALRERLPVTAATGLLLLLLAATIVGRSIRDALGTVALGLALLGSVITWGASSIDVFSLPLLGWLLGWIVAVAGQPRGQNSSRVAGIVVIAVTLLPLGTTVYPTWRAHGLGWLVVVAGSAVAVALVRRGTQLGGHGPIPKRWIPPAWAGGATLVAIAAIGLGGWAYSRLPYQPADRLPPAVADTEDARLEFARSFFDPAMAVHVDSQGSTTAAALSRAAVDARALAALMPSQASRLDSPGTMIATQSEIAERRQGLAAVDIPGRLRALEGTLESQGFRADAFAEAIAAAADLTQVPTAPAALDSALEPWLRRYLRGDEAPHTVRASLQLEAGAAASSVLAITADGRELTATGPRIAGWRDAQRRGETLLLLVATGLWLGALVTWVAGRSFAGAIAVAVAAAGAVGATVTVLHLVFDHALSPLSWPAMLIASATTFAVALPCCHAAVHRRAVAVPRVAMSMITPAIVCLAFVASNEPLWQTMAAIMAAATVLGVGFGCFVAPGLVRAARVATWHSKQESEAP